MNYPVLIKNITAGIFFMLTVLNGPAAAQLMEAPSTAEIPQQSAYVEFGGNALAYSLNYDALFKSGWGIRLGGGFYPHDFLTDEFRDPADDSYAFLGLAMGLYAFGKSASKLELGAGLLFGTIYDNDRWDLPEPPGATFSIGYRYYPIESKHFSFKAAFTPTITKTGLHPRLGISLGITLTPEGDIK